MEHAAKTLLEQIQINPVIAAVCNEDELKHALNSDCRVVFLLMGNVLDIGELTRRVHERKKLCVIHIDLIEGLSSKEIAGVLIISERTVQTHLASIYDKLGARNKTEAMLLALKYGIVALEELIE